MKNKVLLYTTGCPKCSILKSKLKLKDVEFSEISDIEEIKAKGYMQVPMLEVDGEVMDYLDAIRWVNKREIKV